MRKEEWHKAEEMVPMSQNFPITSTVLQLSSTHTFTISKKEYLHSYFKKTHPVPLRKSHSPFLLRDKALEKDEVYFSKLVKHF